MILPYPGLQNDEVIFVPADYGVPGSAVFLVFRQHLPLMLLSYMGTLKSWLYAGILNVFPPSSWTVRLPVLFLGAATVWLFVELLQAIQGSRAAWLGGLLLATDTMFLVTDCFDWGPVVLQHLLLVAGLLLVMRFVLRSAPSALFWGFFCFGLGLWDKALLLWNLSGLALAALIVYWGALRARLTIRNTALASGGLVLGALPLIAYNLAFGGATIRSNATFRFDEFASKFGSLRRTWNGSAVLGYIVSLPGQAGQPRDARNVLERLSYLLHSLTGDHPKNRLEWAFLAAVILTVLLWRSPARKKLLFFLLALAVAWFQMAITKDAGASAHHVVLLWPLAYLFLAVAFAEAASRWGRLGAGLVAAAVVYLVAQNLLVTNQHFYLFARYGSPRSWTDAIYSLSADLRQEQTSQIVLSDWGIFNSLIVLQRNRLPLAQADENFLSPSESDSERQRDRQRLETGLWVGHTLPYREINQVNDSVMKAAAMAGFHKQILRLVSDTHGSPAYEIFRFVPGPN
ncbi:MAG TPA: glycosyltransferase family 39 protein [Bryobacteraceae bacterium]|nr:glycosyltransferase family 39 protein [Bryobacteraceae bacterium]